MRATSCNLSVKDQLAHLLLLEDGWYDGEGTAYDGDVLIKARAALDAIVADGVPMPFIYPTIKNEVRAEWEVDTGAAVLTIDADASEVTLVVIDDDTDGTDLLRCPVDDARLHRRLLEVFAVNVAGSAP